MGNEDSRPAQHDARGQFPRAAQPLTVIVVTLMGTQAALGLWFPTAYRDADWIVAAWWGNDWFTLIVAVAVLTVALMLTRRGSTRALLIWIGMLAYGVYNYAFYLFGAALNVFFPIYVLTWTASSIALIVLLSGVRVEQIADQFDPETPARFVGAYLAGVGVVLAGAWLAMWAGYEFAGLATPVEPEVFKLVAALDLSMMVPALVIGGVLLWRRRPWGYVIAAGAGIQATLYLMVLSVNSIVTIARGLAVAPGELPVWGTLASLTALTVVGLLSHARR